MAPTIASIFIFLPPNRYLDGVRARVWVDDVATHVDFARAQFLKMLAVDPWIHLEAQRSDDGLGHVSMSLAWMVSYKRVRGGCGYVRGDDTFRWFLCFSGRFFPRRCRRTFII